MGMSAAGSQTTQRGRGVLMVLRPDFYKIGVVVPSLEEGVAKYQQAFDYDFVRIPSAPFPVSIGDEIRIVETRAAITRQRPRLHLIEAIPDTPWTPTSGAAHHLAYWVDDLAAAEADIAPLGYTKECGDAAEDPAERTWGYYSQSGRMRIELMKQPMPLAQWDEFIDSSPTFE